MMDVRKTGRALCFGASFALALFLACAGTDPPQLSAEQADAIRTAYEGAAAGAGGAGAGGGAGAPSAGGAGGGAGTQVGSSTGGSGGGSMTSVAGSGGGANSGSAGTGGSGGAVQTCNGFAVLAANCATSGCHGEGSNLEDFAASEQSARAFIDQPGTLACAGQGVVIDPSNPAESLLIRKLSDDPPCGSQMPSSSSPLSTEDIECLEDWISGL